MPRVPTQQEVAARIGDGLRQLAHRDRYLLNHQAMECAIAHRLAVYLELKFPGWHVDCEYRREGKDPKQVTIDGQARRARSDIIVHRRGPAGPNLLAIEIKQAENDEDRRYDLAKLGRYRAEQRYSYALYLELPIGPFA